MIEEFIPSDPEPFFDGPPAPAAHAAKRAPLNPQEAFARVVKIFTPAAIGLVLIGFGLTTTGSYYMPASRFGGVLADLWYGWQAGTLLAMIGVILVYDAVKRTGYL